MPRKTRVHPYRSVSVDVWKDEWFRKLSPHARHLWLHLLISQYGKRSVPGIIVAKVGSLQEDLGWPLHQGGPWPLGAREAHVKSYGEAAALEMPGLREAFRELGLVEIDGPRLLGDSIGYNVVPDVEPKVRCNVTAGLGVGFGWGFIPRLIADWSAPLILLPNAVRYAPLPDNPNGAISWWKTLADQVPPCALRDTSARRILTELLRLRPDTDWIEAYAQAWELDLEQLRRNVGCNVVPEVDGNVAGKGRVQRQGQRRKEKGSLKDLSSSSSSDARATEIQSKEQPPRRTASKRVKTPQNAQNGIGSAKPDPQEAAQNGSGTQNGGRGGARQGSEPSDAPEAKLEALPDRRFTPDSPPSQSELQAIWNELGAQRLRLRNLHGQTPSRKTLERLSAALIGHTTAKPILEAHEVYLKSTKAKIKDGNKIKRVTLAERQPPHPIQIFLANLDIYIGALGNPDSFLAAQSGNGAEGDMDFSSFLAEEA